MIILVTGGIKSGKNIACRKKNNQTIGSTAENMGALSGSKQKKCQLSFALIDLLVIDIGCGMVGGNTGKKDARGDMRNCRRTSSTHPS